MKQVFRKFAVLLIAVGLALGGTSSHSFANIQSADNDSASLHEVHHVQNYTDLAIEPGEECLHSDMAPSTQHSHDDGSCKKCCAACMTASLVPTVSTPLLILLVRRGTFPSYRNTLLAHSVPTDPGIPKPL